MRDSNLFLSEEAKITLDTAKGRFSGTLKLRTSKHNPKLFIITLDELNWDIRQSFCLIHAKTLMSKIAKHKRFITKYNLAKIEKKQNNSKVYFYSIE